ncbi:Glutaredoxin [Candidatus Xenohaliotis californiensis]|uniref:Glutaredoxin n=1 Tax=Candidatus Xenohaliotis californiensis TaxID=84677 RepID=A0ABP0ESC1_9RICK|nr:Glutaredoxin [Candidatus Xenohaliotis californiensis]
MTTKKNKKITIYSTRICPYCSNAKAIFDNMHLEYNEIFIDTDEARNAMINKSNGHKTVPQIFIDEHHIGGYTDLVQLVKNNKLEKLL